VTYLVPGDAPSWLEETLELLEIPDEKIEWASDSVYHANNLILPSFPLQTRQDYEWIVETTLKNINHKSLEVTPGNNIYISRSKAIERQVVNEDEVMSVLSKYEFERYYLEDMSVAENISLFHEADFVVGAHGAGLTDLIYSTNTTVIELFGSKVKVPYKELARTMDVNYESVICTPKSTDIVVEIGSLANTIESHTR